MAASNFMTFGGILITAVLYAGLRVPVGGQSRFVCVDGPEFDGHEVDFDMLIKRQRIYLAQEEIARRRYLAKHECRAASVGG